MFSIRQMKREDIPEMALIFVAEFSRQPYGEVWDADDALDRLEDLFMDSDHSLVISEGERLIGFCLAHRYTWHEGYSLQIDELVISEEYRGQGMGTMLIQRIEGLCAKSGIKLLSVTCMEGSNAYEFYQDRQFHMTPYRVLTKRIEPIQ